MEETAPARGKGGKGRGCMKGCGLGCLVVILLILGGVWWTNHFIRNVVLARSPLPTTLPELTTQQHQSAPQVFRPLGQAVEKARETGSPQEVTLNLEGWQLNELLNLALIPPGRDSYFEMVEVGLDSDKVNLRWSMPMEEGFHLNGELKGRVVIKDYDWQVKPDSLRLGSWNVPAAAIGRPAMNQVRTLFANAFRGKENPLRVRAMEVANSRARLLLHVTPSSIFTDPEIPAP